MRQRQLAAAALAVAISVRMTSASLEGYMNHDGLMQAVRLLDASDHCTVHTLATTNEGREVPLLVLATDANNADLKPALLIVAGLDGRHLVGTETAIRVTRMLLEQLPESLMDMTVYVVPRMNPDAAERNLREVTHGQVTTLTPIDDDRDGQIDEDGPRDVNGDGAVTLMRRLSPPIDDPPTHMADPNEPRLLKKPDALKGERAIYSVYVEGIDSDGDGLIGEDGIGGVDLDKNFLHLWPEFDRDSGATQLSEPQSLALARFVVDHPNIVMAMTYGRHDNLVNVPPGKGKDELNRGPRDIDGADVPLYKEMSDLFKELTGQKRAPAEDIAGSFHAWLYAHRGIPSFATVVWGRPDPSKAQDDKTTNENSESPSHEGASSGTSMVKSGESDSLSGTWSGSAAVPEMGDIPLTLNLQLDADGGVTGTIESMPGTAEVTGTFHGSNLNLIASFGPQFSLTMELRIDGELMSGSTITPEGTTANITARRTSVPATPAQTPSSDKPGKKNEMKPADEEAAAWLAYSDRNRNSKGFMDWTPFDHPTLGKVEIGGFTWHFKMNPPADELDALAAKQTEFALKIMSKRPKLSTLGPTVNELAAGLYEIRLAVINEGLLPTKTHMAVQNRATHPTIVRISTPVDRIVSGERISRVWGVAGSGGRSTHHWIVREHPGSDLSIEVTDVLGGTMTFTFKAETHTSAQGATQ